MGKIIKIRNGPWTSVIGSVGAVRRKKPDQKMM